MKKFFTLLICLFVPVSAFATLNAGEVVTTVATHTSVKLVFDGAASSYDTLYICYIADGGDTTFATSAIDSTTADTLMVDLTERTPYAFFTLARGATGLTDVSELDTVATYKTQLGDFGRKGFLSRYLATDASWPAYDSYRSLDYVFDLSGVAASDYSLIYYSKEYNGVDIIASQAGDSVKASLYFLPVHIVPTKTDTMFYRDTVIADSVASFDTGLTRASVSLPVGMFYQVYIYTLAGNGKDADIKIYLNSEGGDE